MACGTVGRRWRVEHGGSESRAVGVMHALHAVLLVGRRWPYHHGMRGHDHASYSGVRWPRGRTAVRNDRSGFSRSWDY